MVVRIPEDYFVTIEQPLPFQGHGLFIRWAGRVGRNILGVVLVALGVVMALPGVPGQGLLTILFGIMLLDIPGKRSLERRLVRRPAIHKAINRLRARYKKPPIQLLPLASHTQESPSDPKSSRGGDQLP